MGPANVACSGGEPSIQAMYMNASMQNFIYRARSGFLFEPSSVRPIKRVVSMTFEGCFESKCTLCWGWKAASIDVHLDNCVREISTSHPSELFNSGTVVALHYLRIMASTALASEALQDPADGEQLNLFASPKNSRYPQMSCTWQSHSVYVLHLLLERRHIESRHFTVHRRHGCRSYYDSTTSVPEISYMHCLHVK